MAKKKQAKKADKARRRKLPSDKPLPGMENMHHPTLGPLAEQVATIRRERAEGVAEEKQIGNAVLPVMHRENRTVFRAHGVTFVREVGVEKLRIQSAGIKGKQVESEAGS
jgi:hypothetical protein